MSVPMKKSDPAYWLLEEGLSGKRKIKKSEVFNENCYICRDPEFALMGLPLCYPCPICGAHVPADDCTCDNGHDVMEYYEGLEEDQEIENQPSANSEELIGDKIIREIVEEKQKDLDDFWNMIK